MALAYQVSCAPGSKTLLADKTLGGGNRVKVYNGHATLPMYVGGDENELATGGGATLSGSVGFAIPANTSADFILRGNEALYGRGNGTTTTITAYIFRSG